MSRAAEASIKHESGAYFVLEVRGGKLRYEVCKSGLTHASVDSAYALTADGLSLAVARCDYLASKAKESAGCAECGVARRDHRAHVAFLFRKYGVKHEFRQH